MDDEGELFLDHDALRLHGRVADLRRSAERLAVVHRLALAVDDGTWSTVVDAIAASATAADDAATAAEELLARSTDQLARFADDADAAPVDPAELRALLTDLRERSTEVLRLGIEQPDHALLAARWGAGLATTSEAAATTELAALCGALLDFERVAGCGDLHAELPDRSALVAWVAGALAHVDAQPPGFAVFHVVGTDNRYVQVALHGDGEPRVESVGNGHLAAAEQLSGDDHRALARLGYDPPGDESPNWWQEPDAPTLPQLAALVADTLATVHGVDAGAVLRVTVDAFDEPPPHDEGDVDDGDEPAEVEERSARRGSPPPSWLLPAAPTVEALADALVLRLVELDQVVDMELLELTVTQGPPDRPALATIAGVDGQVVVRVTAETGDDADRLHALGWPVDDAVAVRRWPADDLLDACWQLVVALFALGIRWDRPLATTTRLRS